MRVHDVCFLDQDAAGRRIAVDGASREAAEGRAFDSGGGGLRGQESRGLSPIMAGTQNGETDSFETQDSELGRVR